jgi:REP element-mobilizing transposase RayT
VKDILLFAAICCDGDHVHLFIGVEPKYSVAKNYDGGFTEINRNLKVYVMSVNSFKWKHYKG